jgi:eukaryotic-like serine/threonine-protein kinase
MSRRAVLQAQQAGQPERASLWEAGSAVREALFGNRTPATQRALAALSLSHDREVEYGAALALSISGDSSRAQLLAHDMQKRFPVDSSVQFSYLPGLRALLALDRADLELRWSSFRSPYRMNWASRAAVTLACLARYIRFISAGRRT